MHDILIHLGQKMRYERKKKKLSQDELADMAGLHPTYVGGIERGERNPTIISLSKITKALEIPVYTLFLNFENNGQREIPTTELAELLQNLDEKNRNIAIKTIQTLLREMQSQ